LSIDCLASAYAKREHPVLAGNSIEVIAGGAAFTVSEQVSNF
jgi:hypothetical protein